MTTEPAFDAEKTRRAIVTALPRDPATHGHAPEPHDLYVPLRHFQALSPEHGLVAGIRGAGKSVWWAALQSEAHRRIIADAMPRLDLDQVSAVDAGFGEPLRPDDYPDPRQLRQLLAEKRTPADVWRTVIAWHTWGKTSRGGESALTRVEGWNERVDWIVNHPEEAAHAFTAYDDELAAGGRKHLVLFDALDRAASDWQALRRLLRGLIEILLELRRYRAVRAKAFVRPEMLDDQAVTDFFGASKIIAGGAELRWARVDLYGLLFQRLANAPEGGEAIRAGCVDLGSGRWFETQGIRTVPKLLRENEDCQREVFHGVAGKWMGRDHRRGFPYTWLPSHLVDAADQVSPRSFLAAIRRAAEYSPDKPWPYALHYEGIKKGVLEGCRIRGQELEEEFFWIPTVLEPLEGVMVPCDDSEISERWQRHGVIERLRKEAARGDVLLPRHVDEGHEGLRDDLLDLGLLKRMQDGRINMPEVYRLAFGLGRRGGVKPIR